MISHTIHPTLVHKALMDKQIYERFTQVNKKEEVLKYNLIKKIQEAVLRQNKNCNIVIVGKPGSGKSWACLRVGERIANKDRERFNINHVFFNKKQFMQYMGLELPIGSVGVFEEVGVNYSSRKYHENTHMDIIMQTMRYKRRVLIMNVPDISFIDKRGRHLIDAIFKMDSTINLKKNLSKMTPYFQENDGLGFIKKGYPLLDGMLVSEVFVNRPSKTLRQEYERRAKQYKDGLNKKQLELQEMKDRLLSEKARLEYLERKMTRNENYDQYQEKKIEKIARAVQAFGKREAGTIGEKRAEAMKAMEGE